MLDPAFWAPCYLGREFKHLATTLVQKVIVNAKGRPALPVDG